MFYEIYFELVRFNILIEKNVSRYSVINVTILITIQSILIEIDYG